ncbi:RNB domain-containing ribonuclease [Meiothermus taiwanensis]|jgi:exoribonuclease-2|uniref:Ribonuclease II n=2 Tax=Meiothermus taiwanensis TaxID=172827 RepID=A0ABM6WMC8_9DEIN|nr:RNB domain-containing ribonuclease [Meiothermus taiwanensis]AWR88023.1 ribonuclease II [Meiothermus taiwanensis WR-220]KIQ53870.1 exoribonuclease II [Meiothermus taiwanensis]
MSSLTAALVIYRQRPALAWEKEGRLELLLSDGERVRVRSKDVLLLHPGPASLELAVPEGEEEAAWELLKGEQVSLKELAELVYGAYTPEAAYGAYLLAQRGERFALEGEGVRARTEEELSALLRAREEREARERAFREGVERLKKGNPGPEDRPLLQEVEALALGKRKESPVLRALGLSETPEAAHGLLLRLGVWHRENPHPSRLGLPLTPPGLPVPPLPEEERENLTHLPAFAIDDEGSRDPDDAVYAERVGEGFRLLVHVADVAALVPPHSPLDEEARRRGANLYLPEGTMPMLPEEATQILGLGLREVSPALTFELRVSEEGELLEERIYPSWVRAVRLTYREALEVEGLEALKALAEVLRRRRLAQGALDLALPEVKVRVEGEAIQIHPLPPYKSRVWVREAMLLAGYAAAHLALREGLPFPFATQEAPSRRVEGEGLSALWEQRKALKRAQLRAVPAPHKGLGLPLYAQVTSPLRRYLDLVAHQQLRAWLRGEKPLAQGEILERVGAAEAVADLVREAERKSRLHWTLLYLQEKGYEGPGVLVERRGGQGVFLLPELGLSAQVILPAPLALDAEARLRFLEADIPGLEARFALL